MNLSQLKADVDFLCGTTSASYSDTNKVRNMNIAYHDVARTIWESDGTWAFDDANNGGTTPVAYRTIANASATYLIPTTALRIEGVEIKNANGDWTKLTPINYQELYVSPEEYLTGTGLPLKYMLEGNEIRLFPAPGTGYTTMSSGLAVRLNRAVTEFATTATTAEPGFAVPFHRILSYAAAIDFTQDDRQREFLVAQKARLEKGLVRFYSNRWDEGKSILKPSSKRNRIKYE
jgi:hypothetical protein